MFINTHFKKLFKNKSRFQIVYGGAGSGKSHAILQKIILDTLQGEKKKWLIIRKVRVTLRQSVFALFMQIISENGLSGVFTPNKTNLEIICDNGNSIICTGLDDSEKLKSIAGITSCYIEEASEITQSDFEQINLRLRDIHIKNPQIIMSFNPIDETHWIKKYFFDSNYEDLFIHHSTYHHNAFITDVYKKELEKLEKRDYNYYRIYTLGEWGCISHALIFKNLKFGEIKISEHQMSNIRYGLDFGYNDPTVLIGSGWYDGCLYIFREWYASEMVNRDFISMIENESFERDYWIIADSSRPDLIEEWNQAGFNVAPSQKGKKSVKKGVDYLKSLPYIYIDDVRCPNTAREFKNYKYRELKCGRILDEPVDIDNHTIDAVRYANEDLKEDLKPVFTRGLY